MKQTIEKIVDAMRKIESVLDKPTPRGMNKILLLVVILALTNPVIFAVLAGLLAAYGIFKLVRYVLELLI